LVLDVSSHGWALAVRARHVVLLDHVLLEGRVERVNLGKHHDFDLVLELVLVCSGHPCRVQFSQRALHIFQHGAVVGN